MNTGTGSAPGRAADPDGGPATAATAATVGAGSGAGSGSSPGAGAGDGGPEGGTDSATDALERELSVLFRRARATSGQLSRAVHPELEPAAYGLLLRLEQAQPERATDLAAYFGVGKATMSRQLRALEELGLVTREHDPADGRAYLMRLTEEGRQRFARVRGARRERYLRQLTSWDRGEVAELARLLHRLNESQKSVP